VPSALSGDARDPAVARRAAGVAGRAGPLPGWVNNAAVFRDATLRHGAAGALPCATAKAAVESLTRPVAVDHGPDGIRANAVAPGSISTARFEEYRAAHPETDGHMAALHPVSRVGTPAGVADTVAFLLSEQAGFISGITLPVGGGRAANGLDPRPGRSPSAGAGYTTQAGECRRPATQRHHTGDP
jgi:hypothetical protein